MPKVDVNQVAEILKRNDLDPKLLRQIIEEINLATQPEDDKEPRKSVKKQFVMLVSDPEEQLPPRLELTGWVLQIPEDESIMSTLGNIHLAAYDFNASKKGRLMPVKTIGEALESIPEYKLAERSVWCKTKTPVFLLRTDNELPRDFPEDTKRRPCARRMT